MKHRSLKAICLAGLVLALTFFLFVYSQVQLHVGYVVILPTMGNTPVATALFSFTDSSGVLVWEAGVGAVEPIRSGRIFVDQKGARTAIALANPSADAVAATLVLRDSSGMEIDRKSLKLDPREHKARFVEEADLFPNVPKDFVGSLSFETAQSTQKLAAITLRENTNSRGEKIFATLPVVDLAAPASTGSFVFPQIGAGSTLSTQIVLVNPSGQRIGGLVKLFDSNGNPLNLELTTSLTGQPVSQSAGSQFLYQIEPNGTYRAELNSVAGTGVGYAVVTLDQGSTAPSGSAIFQFKSGGQVISEAGVAAVRPTTLARIFVDTVGTRTGVAIASANNPATKLTFNLLNRNGGFIDTRSRDLPALGHLSIFADELFADMPPGFTGLMEISSPVPVAPVSLKLTTNTRNEPILTTLPIADLDRPVVATSLVLPQIGFGPTGNGDFSTRLIFINSDKAKFSGGTLNFYQSNGSNLTVPLAGQLGSQFSYQIGAGAGRQFRPANTVPLKDIILDLSNPELTEVAVNEGSTVQLAPVGIDSVGSVRDDFDFNYAITSGSQVASVDAAGNITGNKAGFSRLSVSSGGVPKAVNITVGKITSGQAGFEITGVAQDLARRLYLSNTKDHTVLLAQELTKTPELYAGSNKAPGLVNDERLKSRFQNPAFLSFNQQDGNLYVSDSGNNAIRRVGPGPSGKVETLALNQALNNPQGVALDDRGNLWVADSGSHTIKKINLKGREVSLIAGQPGSPGLADGTGSQARFNSPVGLAIETESLVQQLQRQRTGAPPPPVSVIVADTGNGRVRRVREDGKVETIGSVTSKAEAPVFRASPALPLSRSPAQYFSTLPLSPSPAPSLLVTLAIFTSPTGVAVDPAGNIYVTEPARRTVKTILQNGTVVLAAQANTFTGPRGVGINSNGQVVVADSTRSAAQITYGAPEIDPDGIQPGTISARGGDNVVIKGNNFAPETLVIIAGSVIPIRIVDTQSISFVAPPLPSGLTTLTVQNRGGLVQKPFFVDPVPLNELASGFITTVAGGSTFIGDGAPATSASLSSPFRIAVDSVGNIFIGDSGNNRIRRIDAGTGIITTVAGNGQDGFSGDNGPAVAASLSQPGNTAIDSAGNLFIIDNGNSRIRKVDAKSGTISTLITGATSATALALDAAGNLYIADAFPSQIRKLDTGTGIITRVVGNGQNGFSGDDGPATAAALNVPHGLAIDPAGNIFIADTANYRIRKVSAATGIITTIAGNGQAGDSGDNGLATAARIEQSYGLALDVSGNVYIADTLNRRIRRVDASTGIITIVAGNGQQALSGDNGPALIAGIGDPYGVAVDAGGNLFISDSWNNRIRKVDPRSGIITTAAGSSQDISGDDGPAIAAVLKSSRSVAIDTAGNLLIADTDDQRIRKVNVLTGIITTVAGDGTQGFSGDKGPAAAAKLRIPFGIAVDTFGNLFIADSGNNAIRKVDANTQIITTVAGDAAGLSFPRSVALDLGGNIFIADTGNHRIRKVDAKTGIIATVAGNGQQNFSGDNGPALAASVPSPLAIALDAGGNLFIADISDRIRRVDRVTGIITTVAGSGLGFSGDNGPATAAALNTPEGITLDTAGNLFIADTSNGRIRRVDAKSGIITTVAGGGVLSDNVPATATALGKPSGVALDSAGNLFIADTENHRVRAVRGPIK